VPPHFNHLGSDVARSMILFAEGKPLGVDGLRRLKIHLVNLTDLKKKASIDERAQYADDILDDILDSADQPLNVRRQNKSNRTSTINRSNCMFCLGSTVVDKI
jgi:DNA-directed RNA polymerase, mitochondrial